MTSYDGLLRRARVRTSTRPHGRGTAVFSDMAFSYVSLVSRSRLDLLIAVQLQFIRMPALTLHPPPRFGTCSWKYDSWRGIVISTTTTRAAPPWPSSGCGRGCKAAQIEDDVTFRHFRDHHKEAWSKQTTWRFGSRSLARTTPASDCLARCRAVKLLDFPHFQWRSAW